MKETLLILKERATATVGQLLRRLLTGGRIATLVRGSLFVGTASTLGFYLALELFVPDELVLNKVNAVLAPRGLALEAEGVGYSLFLSASLDEVSVRSGGETVLTAGKVFLSPSLWSLVAGSPEVTVIVEEIDGKEGELSITAGSDEEACYRLEAHEASLAVLRVLWPATAIGGTLSGTGELCRDKKLSGEFDLTAEQVTLGGTVYGLALEKPLALGAVRLSGTIKENKLDIREVTALGDIDLQVDGKATLTPGALKNSRLELSADLEEKKPGAIAQIPLLELALSRFKDPGGNGYAMKISGNLTGPSVRRDSRANRPPRSAKPDFKDGSSSRSAAKNKERAKEKEPEKAPLPEPDKEGDTGKKMDKEPGKEVEKEEDKDSEKEAENGSDDKEKIKNDTEETP